MDRIRPEELRTGEIYDAERSSARASAVEQRRLRRVDLGERLSLVFENRHTLRAAAEELLRAERVVDPDRVAAEVATFNAVLPAEGSLTATLYFDVSDAADLPAALSELEGAAAHLYIDVAGSRAAASAEPVSAAEQNHAAVLVTFPLSEAQQDAWREGAPVSVGVEHPRYRASVPLGDDQRAAVASDL
jgi:hypothetical protein